ncbi:cysteine desulfurase family protein (TIGR01976 family) [Christiangramia gaetbulicola]|uniref:Cysteine desulfurase family protein (TIGR01976 family) n=1 Tax=Christiangramia gaetbulicola TaxID=703340 RepID=A0A2T6AM80_9FLAO|nr:cysteine desulfurase-like protein [Christiangramia gaetbulicola]PTX44887.1 cysteine desulfurase family protein (TIGR01976 family) [Christiangramia gaetbulicola]
MMDIEYVREQFPALSRDFIFMDNAGGSQVLKKVIERISGYLVHHNVQLGASYKVSAEAGGKLKYATSRIAELVNASRDEEVVIGSSTTMLQRILSLTISSQWKKGDEVIVTDTDHEANVSPWMDLQEKGIKVKTWQVNKETLELEISDLQKLMTERTKLVAVTHASNVLGTINPIKKITQAVHEAGALICVDGVAYAPHRKVDVKDLDADFYTFSWYKTFGPHLAVMYGKYEELAKLDSINHYFIGKESVPYKLQPGNFNFELTYSTLGIIEYYDEIFRHHFGAEKASYQERLTRTFELIASHEEKLATLLLDYLNSVPEVRIIGISEADRSKRVPTISFVHEKFKSEEIVEKVDGHRIGIRFGDFYAKKLIQALDLEEKNGVVRVSLVHYNTTEEVRKLIGVFKGIF